MYDYKAELTWIFSGS